ncbi:3'-5' DNA helicase [Arachnomyces sp. PD_36]|nr:3'-5' DNA helicase [Arachnomyces sp. PD_36]
MRSNGDDDDDFDIDDFDIFDIEAAEASATPDEGTQTSNVSCEDSPRPLKRRRLNRGPSLLKNGERRPRSQSDDDSISTSSDDDDLPTTSEEEARRSIAPPSKYKIHISKGANIQENTFVTQLTQPPSSPSRIRGPRWKKPDPEPSPDAVAQVPGTPPGGGLEDEDEDIRAAIAASLQYCQPGQISPHSNSVPSTHPSGSHPINPQLAPEPPDKSNQGGEPDIWDDDIPDDAFDSLSFPSPDLDPAQESILISSQPAPIPQRRPTNTQQANLRQTTLLGGTAREPATSNSQTVSRHRPINRNEPPTHHKLNDDATKTWVYPTNLGTIRDYQFNISHRGLFHNLLVALPTGLGKTFIAATIMLNWFRWTKDAQIVFVAPTKPLVSQQVKACFGIVGIPRSQTTMLTGDIQPGIRAEEWKEKRVFFMTPQTLINDLKKGIADPKRIVLLVVDEAHRATGNYSYVEVVSFLRRFNSSFRVLALTATPGATVEGVQAVIDGLDISRVEIRTEQSLDIREFVHTRNVETQSFENSEEMLMAMEMFSKVLQPSVDKLRGYNAHWVSDPMLLNPYGLTQQRQKWMNSEAARNTDWGFRKSVTNIFGTLATLAQAIELLKYHGIIPFYNNLVAFRESTMADGEKGPKIPRQIVEHASFKQLMGRLKIWTSNAEFVGHPKLEYLKSVVLNHFMDAGEGSGGANGRPPSDTRIMIFVNFRDNAEVITKILKRHEPMIRPHVFVGQSNARNSDGMDQKKQLDVVQKFKNGVYNTIVATSIGEEGLDIGEVDLIVCYDSSASPVRMLQRMGRTGRKRAGKIVLLLMKGKEEESYTKAKDNYEKMQQMIAAGSGLNFHDDKSPRILPRDIQPVVERKQIEIPIENTQHPDLPVPKKKGRAPKAPAKKFHMPDGVETGFTKASDLGGKKKRGKSNTTEREPTPPPIVETVDVPSLDEVLLSSSEQMELEQRYCHIGGTSPQYIQRPQNDVFPDLQRSYRPTKSVRHGTVTRRVVRLLKTMHTIEPNCDNRFKRTLHPEDIQPSPNSPSKRTEPTKFKPPKPPTLKETPSNHSRRTAQTPPPPSPGEEPYSSLMCSQSPFDLNKELPFFPFLPPNNDSDLDFDLPDVDALMNSVTAAGKGKEPAKRASEYPSPGRVRKNRRLIFDDDDSDF